MGYVVSNDIVRSSPDKTRAVKNFPVPCNVKNVQSFLGLTGYFWKFIPKYAEIAKPLSDLLRKTEEFSWRDTQQQSFGTLKSALVNDLVLKLFKVGAETEVHTDASQLGYGMVLLQRDAEDNLMHLVYFASRKTTPAEEKYCSYELEVLAVVNALKKFRVYLAEVKFKIVADCQVFALIMKKKRSDRANGQVGIVPTRLRLRNSASRGSENEARGCAQ